MNVQRNAVGHAVGHYGQDHMRQGPKEDNSARESGKKQKLTQSKAPADSALSPPKVIENNRNTHCP